MTPTSVRELRRCVQSQGKGLQPVAPMVHRRFTYQLNPDTAATKLEASTRYDEIVSDQNQRLFASPQQRTSELSTTGDRLDHKLEPKRAPIADAEHRIDLDPVEVKHSLVVASLVCLVKHQVTLDEGESINPGCPPVGQPAPTLCKQ